MPDGLRGRCRVGLSLSQKATNAGGASRVLSRSGAGKRWFKEAQFLLVMISSASPVSCKMWSPVFARSTM